MLPSSISEWVFLWFIWCSLSPPTIHIQPYWILRLRDPSFGHHRSITNDNIKVALWAWPSKCRSTKQEIMLDFNISMNKHVVLESWVQFRKILKVLMNWLTSRMCVMDVRFNEKRLLCRVVCFWLQRGLNDDATQDVFRVPSNWSDIWSFPWTPDCQTH